MEALSVPAPRWRLTYAGRDVSAELAPMVTAVTYADHLTGTADTIRVTLEDSDGRWRGGWYPVQGDVIALEIGYAGQPLLPCGTFEVRRLTLSGPPDTLEIAAEAAAITAELRTRRSAAYEAMDLAAIAGRIAARHGLTVVGTVQSPVWERITQHDETDVAFLRRLSDETGHVFAVRGTSLVFHGLAELRAAEAAVTVGRRDCTRYRWQDEARGAYRAAVARYHDPNTKTVIESTATDPAHPGGDVLAVGARTETRAQADQAAQAALDRANKDKRTGTLTLSGEPRLVAGIVVAATGFESMDGHYLVERSTHRVNRKAGYVTEIALSLGGAAPPQAGAS